jgi:hypothetical protein
MTPIPEPVYYPTPPVGPWPRCMDCRRYPKDGRTRELCPVHLCTVHGLTFAPESCYQPRIKQEG